MKRKLRSNPSRLSAPGERVQVGGSWRADKPNANARGYDYAWQCYRLEYLAANPVCKIRGLGCTLAATIVDHVIPHRGNAALFKDAANHQSACQHCHNAHKQRQERIA